MEPTLQITRDVVRELGPSMVAFARRVSSSREDAEDLVQEMWMGALGAAPNFEGRSSVRTWLTAILRRRIAQRYRRPRVFVPFDEEQLPREYDDSAADLLARREHVEHLARLFPELTNQERQALIMCTVDELDRDQVCAQLGITRGHLRVLLHRARRRLETFTP